MWRGVQSARQLSVASGKISEPTTPLDAFIGVCLSGWTEGSDLHRRHYRERLRWQFRAEMFNAVNHPQFSYANTTFGSAQFGRVTALAPGNAPRTIQFALRMEF